MEYNLIDKMIVKEILNTVRNDRNICSVLPKTSEALLEKMLDEDIEQLEAEIMLDTIKKFGRGKDE